MVTAILALELLKGNSAQTSWSLLSSLLLVFLASLLAVTWYCGVANAKASTYLVCFHETRAGSSARKWETRLEKLGKAVNVNQLLAIVYLILGALAVTVPWLSAKATLPDLSNAKVLVATGLFVACLVPNFASWYLRGYFGKRWQAIRVDEVRQDGEAGAG